MGVFSCDLWALSEGRSEGAPGHFERVLFEHGVSPQVRHSAVERGESGRAGKPLGGAAKTSPELRAQNAGGFDRGVGSGGIPLVGAAEGNVANVDAMDSQTLRYWPREGTRIIGDQPAADGSPAARPEDASRRRLYGRTKPGLLLKHQIAIKTDSWDVQCPGFTEIDLVSHSGNSGAGEFGHTLNVTDIHSTWTESRAVLGRSQPAVLAAIQEVEQALPFALRGVDCDNGSEFINWNLRAGASVRTSS